MRDWPALANILFLDIVAFTEFASRMESSGVAGRIHVTEAIQAKLEGKFLFEERGMVDVKGVGLMKTYFLTGKK